MLCYAVENVSVIEFLYQIDLFSIQFFFTKSIQITKLKIILLSKLNFNFNSTFFVSNQIEQLNDSNNQIFQFQITELFKIQNRLITNSAFFKLLSNLGNKFAKFPIFILQLSQLAKSATKNR